MTESNPGLVYLEMVNFMLAYLFMNGSSEGLYIYLGSFLKHV